METLAKHSVAEHATLPNHGRCGRGTPQPRTRQMLRDKAAPRESSFLNGCDGRHRKRNGGDGCDGAWVGEYHPDLHALQCAAGQGSDRVAEPVVNDAWWKLCNNWPQKWPQLPEATVSGNVVSDSKKDGSATGKRYVDLPIFSVLQAKPASLLASNSAAQNQSTSITEKF